MKISRLFLLLMVVGALFVPAVSAYEETFEIDERSQSSFGISNKYDQTSSYFNKLYFSRIQDYYGVYSITLESSDTDPFVLTDPSKLYHCVPLSVMDGATLVTTGTISYNKNLVNNKFLITLTFDNPDAFYAYSGAKGFALSNPGFNLVKVDGGYIGIVPAGKLGICSSYAESGYGKPGNYYVLKKQTFTNILQWDETDDYTVVTILRNIEEDVYTSRGEIWTDRAPYYNESTTRDISVRVFEQPINVKITSLSGNVFTRIIGESAGTPEEPESSTLNVYVRSSQTNALIADARVVIEAGFNDPADLQEVSNTTLPSGTKSYTLQPNGGGLPNPDYYRVSVTADGYNSEMPYADITLDAGMSMTMVMGMEPTAGAPEDPGYTYIDVYVRDIYANPIADATVKMGAYTLKTNAAGYTLFDVPVNSTYTYTVKKPGYTSIEGSVTVADAARYPVNIVMGTGVIPTNTPTAEPTVPGATPTVPAGEETPGPGFIDQSANKFASFLGVSYAVGRAALGMLIATAIGFTTARKLKGGAPEFGIGFIAGAALMVLITLLPAWIFIVMVIIVGGLLGYKYMSGGS